MSKTDFELPELFSVESQTFLKAAAKEDAQAFYEVIRDSQEHFQRFDFIAPCFESTETVAGITEILENRRKSKDGVSYGLWDDGELVGLFTINDIDWSDFSADVGFWLIPSATGRGLALKTLIAFKEFCLRILRFSYIRAVTAVSNERSQNLLFRAGFAKDKLLPEHIEVRGRKIDEIQFLAR